MILPSLALGGVSQGTGALASAFQESKEIALAHAPVSTAQGIANALTLPFPINWLQATAVGIAGAARVAAITSASPGGGSSVRTPSSSASSMPNAPQRQQSEQPPQVHEITFRGVDKNKAMSPEEVMDLARRLEDLSRDGQGFKFRIAS